MKIALIGYGKMGRAIEEEALSKGHEIVLRIHSANKKDLSAETLQRADVAIEFSTPSTVLSHIQLCFEAGIPLVVGTTGWHEQLDSVRASLEQQQATLFYASNFSIGVNIFFQLNELFARVMNNFDAYEPVLKEVHHIHKLDSPSGTAITLAERMLPMLDRKSRWRALAHEDTLGSNEAKDPPRIRENRENEDLLIYSKREGDVKGLHSVSYISENDRMVFTHEAFNRQGFAQGVVLAAEWVQGRQGLFTMQDILGIHLE